MNKVTIFFVVVLLIPCTLLAQEPPAQHKKHQLQVLISHTQIHSGLDLEGNRKWQSLPSWGLNYNFQVADTWKIGLHSDIVVEDFQVAGMGRNEADVLDRSYPIASALVASRKLADHFQLLIGIGGEFAPGQRFLLFRGGIEYGYYLDENWELIGNVTNDFKWEAYNSWAIGMGISRLF